MPQCCSSLLVLSCRNVIISKLKSSEDILNIRLRKFEAFICVWKEHIFNKSTFRRTLRASLCIEESIFRNTYSSELLSSVELPASLSVSGGVNWSYLCSVSSSKVLSCQYSGGDTPANPTNPPPEGSVRKGQNIGSVAAGKPQLWGCCSAWM